MFLLRTTIVPCILSRCFFLSVVSFSLTDRPLLAAAIATFTTTNVDPFAGPFGNVDDVASLGWCQRTTDSFRSIASCEICERVTKEKTVIGGSEKRAAANFGIAFRRPTSAFSLSRRVKSARIPRVESYESAELKLRITLMRARARA